MRELVISNGKRRSGGVRSEMQLSENDREMGVDKVSFKGLGRTMGILK